MAGAVSSSEPMAHSLMVRRIFRQLIWKPTGVYPAEHFDPIADESSPLPLNWQLRLVVIASWDDLPKTFAAIGLVLTKRILR